MLRLKTSEGIETYEFINYALDDSAYMHGVIAEAENVIPYTPNEMFFDEHGPIVPWAESCIEEDGMHFHVFLRRKTDKEIVFFFRDDEFIEGFMFDMDENMKWKLHVGYPSQEEIDEAHKYYEQMTDEEKEKLKDFGKKLMDEITKELGVPYSKKEWGIEDIIKEWQ